MAESNKHHRQVRSFVRRAGRMTPAQQRGLEQGMASYGLDVGAGGLDQDRVFGRQAPLVLEIGFGMGHAFVEQAASFPEYNFIGVEVHTPGVGNVLNEIISRELTNVFVYHEDVVAVLARAIPDHSIDKVQVFFPDPWPKKRHNKRRLIQVDFVKALASKLNVGGIVHLATDWAPYALHMQEVMRDSGKFVTIAPEIVEQHCAPPRYSTRFERRGEALGHEIVDLYYQLKK